MDSLALNCHGIVFLEAQGLTPALAAKLQKSLGHFRSREERGLLGREPDFLIRPMESVPDVPVFSRHLNHIYGFTTVECQDRMAVCCLHRGKPEFCLFFSSQGQLTLLFRPVKGQENRFFGLVLFGLHLLVRQQGALMAHASVVVRQGRAVAISGHHGMGKTPILLSLLKQGWQCLGDDKAFLTPQGLFMVEPYLALSLYHFDLLPWLAGFLPGAPAAALPGRVRAVMDRAAGWLWPNGIPVKAYRLLNPGMKIHLGQAPFDHALADQALPVHWIILRKGRSFEEQMLTREKGLQALVLVQSMFFSHRLSMEKALCLHGHAMIPDPETLLNTLLKDTTFSLISCTDAGEIPQICQRVASHVP